MMYWVVLPLFCAVAGAAKLDNTYLPPPNAKEAGGHEDDLQVPLEPPYIDPYSDTNGRQPQYRPQYGGVDSRRTHKNRWNQQGRTLSRGWSDIEDEDQIRDFQDFIPGRPRSRFLYGSYSYTGPDNVLVTVTYTADRKQRGRGRSSYDEYDRGYSNAGRRANGYGYESDEDYPDEHYLEGSVIPTPPSLPGELKKAFAFHSKKYNKSDSRGGKKGYPSRDPNHQQSWDGQTPNQKPVVYQGYSYPKVESN